MNVSKVSQLFSLSSLKLRTPMLFGIIILTALVAFEVFNYSTTEFALHDLLGELRFAGMRWATILAIAFCGIDFAGIARLFTPKLEEEARETWYLFGAWLLAATMNAMLTWWGVSMAILNHNLQSTAVMDAATVSRVVPVFVAIMVWLIRILIIGTISVAADHLMGATDSSRMMPRPSPAMRPGSRVPSPTGARSMRSNAQPSNPSTRQPNASFSQNRNTQRGPSDRRPEPTYSSLSFDDRPSNSPEQRSRSL